MDWCRRAVIPAAIDMRTFILVESSEEGFVEARSYPPFTTSDYFSLTSFNPQEGGDLKYIRAVIRVMLDRGYHFKGLRIRLLKASEASKLVEGISFLIYL
jgi:galactokinase